MQAAIATIWHNPCFKSSYPSRKRLGSKYIREAPGVFQLNEEGMHDACFHV